MTWQPITGDTPLQPLCTLQNWDLAFTLSGTSGDAGKLVFQLANHKL